MNRETLLAWLDYDRETGIMTWKKRPSHRPIPAGSVAGSTAGHGYRFVTVAGERITAHRIAWFLVYGEWPSGQIDHINGKRDDNRIVNLRDVSTTINKQNQYHANANSEVPYIGVSRKRGKFRARIMRDGKEYSIGSFDTAEEAAAAYLIAKKEFHPEAPSAAERAA